ncbi:MAG: DUF6259 domain-containing protein [Candidatus Diapherotrites archaeon]
MMTKGQGALEYLILMGGVTLLAMIVLLALFSSAPALTDILEGNLGGYSSLSSSILDDPVVPVEFEGTFLLENELVRIEFAEENGDALLQSITNKMTGVVFPMKGEYHWEFYLNNESNFNDSIDIYADTASCDPVTVSELEQSGTQSVTFVWPHCVVEGEETVDVRLQVRLDDDSPFSKWRLSLDNHTNNWGIHIGSLFVDIQDQSNDYLAVFSNSGILVEDPYLNYRPTKPLLATTFIQMQAYYVDDGSPEGIYIASEDYRNLHSRVIQWNAVSDSVKGNHTRFGLGGYGRAPLDPDNIDFDMEYDYSIGVFEGDWYDAAKIYRNWALTEGGTVSLGKVEQRTDIPDWYKELGLQLVQNLLGSSYNNGVEVNDYAPLEFFQEVKDFYLPCEEYFDPEACGEGSASTVMGLFEWSWFDNEDNAQYGDYSIYPAMGVFASAAKAASIYLIGYTLSFGYSVDGSELDDMRFYANVDPTTGEPFFISGINVYAMDPAATDWWERYATVFKNQAVENGFMGIYLDNPYIFGLGSHNPNIPTPSNPHNQGQGGTYLLEGYRNGIQTIINNIRETYSDFILVHEQGHEAYEPTSWSNSGQNDAPPNGVNPVFTTNIPLIETIYHDYKLFNYGNIYSNLTWHAYDAYSGQPGLLTEAAQASIASGFIRGKMVTHTESTLGYAVHNSVKDHGDAFAPFVNYAYFLKQLIKVRLSEAKKFLIYGQLLRPLKLEGAGNNITFTYKTMGDNPTPYPQTFPPVMNSVWKASDGSIGVMFINYTNNDESFSWTFDADEYGLSSSLFTMKKLANHDNIGDFFSNPKEPGSHVEDVVFQFDETFPNGKEFNESMPPRSVRFYQITS